MVGPGNGLDPLIPALFAVRLVTVRFLSSSSVAFSRSEYHQQTFEGQARYRRSE